jgi:transcriptional regulator with XRE-family HTH domain
MGRAGNALKNVLETYGISQNQLAVAMGIDRSNLSRWVSGNRDPAAEAVFEIRLALQKINPVAAEEFVRLYLYDSAGDEEQSY